jgi:acyl-CoA reductase-like NAD-dependent aldehyde dehydrogenase
MSKLKLAMLAAMKAKRTWDRLPPEQRERIMGAAQTTVRTHGPMMAKKVADTAKAQAPVVRQRVTEAIGRARKGS